MKTALAIVAGLVVMFGLAWLMDHNTPRSTAGVTVVGDNLVRLPSGDVFVLTQQSGKSTLVWEITYDGQDTVKFDCISWPCTDLSGTLEAADRTVVVDAGWLNGEFTIWRRNDGAAAVKWPWGWTYRPYDD